MYISPVFHFSYCNEDLINGLLLSLSLLLLLLLLLLLVLLLLVLLFCPKKLHSKITSPISRLYYMLRRRIFLSLYPSACDFLSDIFCQFSFFVSFVCLSVHRSVHSTLCRSSVTVTISQKVRCRLKSVSLTLSQQSTPALYTIMASSYGSS